MSSAPALGYSALVVDDQIGKVSLIGAGMRSSPGVSATFFAALAGAGVNIGMISTSEIRISVVVAGADVDSAVTALHTAFGLDSDAPQAVVYAGKWTVSGARVRQVGWNIGVVGATGQVGRVMRQLLSRTRRPGCVDEVLRLRPLGGDDVALGRT